MPVRTSISAACDAIDAAWVELAGIQKARLAEVGAEIFAAESAEREARCMLSGARKSLEISNRLRNPLYIAAAEARVAAAELVWRKANEALGALLDAASGRAA